MLRLAEAPGDSLTTLLWRCTIHYQAIFCEAAKVVSSAWYDPVKMETEAAWFYSQQQKTLATLPIFVSKCLPSWTKLTT